MKRRITAFILCLFIAAALVPATASAEPGRIEIVTFYSDFGGSVFLSIDRMPEPNANDLITNNGSLSTGLRGTVNLLIDTEHRYYWDEESNGFAFEPSGDVPNRDLYVFVVMRFEGGESFACNAVFGGEAASPDFTFENGVLSFTPAENCVYLEYEVFWTRDDYDTGTFTGNDENPVVIDLIWWGNVEVVLPDWIEEENTVRRGQRVKFAVPRETESVTVTWEGDDGISGVEFGYSGGDGDEFTPISGVDSYTIQLDLEFDRNAWRAFYGVTLYFSSGGFFDDPLVDVYYDNWQGSVFFSLGDETPTADADHYKSAYSEDRFSFAPEGEIERVNLLIDPSIRIDRDSEEITFAPTSGEEGEIFVWARCGENGGRYEGPVVERGEAVHEGFEYEDGVLSFTPSYRDFVEIEVFFNEDDYAFSTFGRGREGYITVEAYCWGQGDVSLAGGIPEEDVFSGEGRMKILVPLGTESVTFEWDGSSELREIRVPAYNDDYEDLVLEEPDITSFTLVLDRTWDDGFPREFYNIYFDFDYSWQGRGEIRLSAPGDEVAPFFGLDAPAEPDAESYFWVNDRGYIADDGEGGERIGKVFITFDPTRTLYYPDWAQGIVTFMDIPQREDYSPVIYVRYTTPEGEYREDLAVEDGVAAEGYSFENNVFSFTPATDRGVEIEFFTSEAQRGFDHFLGTGDKPVIAGVYVYGDGDASFPNVDGRDVARYETYQEISYKVRLSEEERELVVNWEGEKTPEVYFRNYETDEEETVSLTDGNSFTVSLGRTFEGGEPWYCYEIVLVFPREDCTYGHSFDEWVTVTEPTCTEEGTESRTCSVCGATETRRIPAAGHQYITNINEPTCTEPGHVVLFCPVCGDLVTQDGDKALGHDFGTDGKAKNCLRCGEPNPNSDYVNPFVDVRDGAYYAPAVQWAVVNGITSGTSKTTFSPDSGCTRGQVVTFLWRTAGKPSPSKTDNPFTDVKEGDYYYEAVLWAVETGITNGTSKTRFSPDSTCTRGQIVTFLYRAKGSPSVGSASNPFSDVKSDDYYYEAVLWAVANEVTNGTDKTHFSPAKTCTRGQVVTFLYRSGK